MEKKDLLVIRDILNTQYATSYFPGATSALTAVEKELTEPSGDLVRALELLVNAPLMGSVDVTSVAIGIERITKWLVEIN